MFLGVDIGTASSKAVAVAADGTLVASAIRPHLTTTPHPGWFEHDAEDVWWSDFRELTHEVLSTVPGHEVTCVGVSGIGPSTLLTDVGGQPLRAAILYGIDTRAEREIEELTETLGAGRLLEVNGNRLTSQAVGPKFLWVARHEPEVWERARRWYGASSWLVQRLTGEYVLDHYSASTSDPLYDLGRSDWWADGWAASAPGIERPRLAWPGDVVGEVHTAAAEACGIAAGTPVVAGTIDALAEAHSVGSDGIGDTMVMYGSTLFLIQTVARPAVHGGLWAASGRTPNTNSVAAGMATSGLVTTWFAEVTGQSLGDLTAQAAEVPAGSDGLVLLPYFAGERTPLFDPRARGCWLGLTLGHTRAHLYRSALEGVAYGVRHNLDAMAEAGAPPRRLVAVGGGTRGNLWTHIVSDVTQLPQDLPTTTIGASYGDARLAAEAVGVDTRAWNPVAQRIEPDPSPAGLYDELYAVFRHTYPAIRDEMHRLAAAVTMRGSAPRKRSPHP
ncbi:MAG: sugar kinase [Sporichthyaceae bacterium]|nr:sugar kinase [Sporichthyaceae bacterium]